MIIFTAGFIKNIEKEKVVVRKKLIRRDTPSLFKIKFNVFYKYLRLIIIFFIFDLIYVKRRT